MAENFSAIDKNMTVETKLNLPDVKFYDVRQEPFRLYGLYNPLTEEQFVRMPDDVAVTVSSGVRGLCKHTAGGRVRFSTDSPYIAIKCEMPSVTRFAHMPLTGSAGFDLYEDTAVGSVFRFSFKPDKDITDGYESVLRPQGKGMRNYTINFPLYSPVKNLYIGIADGSKLDCGMEYRNAKPIVYYGSSITQGACASHPGNSYQAVIAQRQNWDYVNLGFSGNAKGEVTMAEYMAGLDMMVFVSDFDHNCKDATQLRETHQRLYDIIRAKNPDIPYIMLSRPDYDTNVGQSILRRDVVIDTFHYAREEKGDKNVYYIDGEGIFRGPWEQLCVVDGTHPTDVGFMKMADAVERILVRALRYVEER